MKRLNFKKMHPEAELVWNGEQFELPGSEWAGKIPGEGDRLVDLREIFWEQDVPKPAPVRSVAAGDFTETEIKALELRYGAKIKRPAKKAKAA